MEGITVMTSKGQVTIPKSVRDALKLKTGDKLCFVVAGNEMLLLPRNRPIESVFGRLAAYARASTTVGDYDAAIADGIDGHVASATIEDRDAA